MPRSRKSLDVDAGLRDAVRDFWQVRTRQHRDQGSASGRRDAGNRAAVTGGQHCNGFVNLIRLIITDAGLTDADVLSGRRALSTLPGYFRPTKDWDILAIANSELIATVEVKSQVGSLGNNANNRAEEAVGSGYDFQCAYREGAFQPSARPWIGFFMLLEDSPAATEAVAIREPHFPVFPEFKQCSYEDRYRLLCQKLVREKLYDASCLIMSDQIGGLRGKFREPDPEVGIRNFAASLHARVAAHVRTR
jgi:hypothetical protein